MDLCAHALFTRNPDVLRQVRPLHEVRPRVRRGREETPLPKRRAPGERGEDRRLGRARRRLPLRRRGVSDVPPRGRVGGAPVRRHPVPGGAGGVRDDDVQEYRARAVFVRTVRAPGTDEGVPHAVRRVGHRALRDPDGEARIESVGGHGGAVRQRVGDRARVYNFRRDRVFAKGEARLSPKAS